MMEFTPEHYFQTAAQRMRQVHLLFQDDASHALAIYVGGVAVECMLRALKGRHDPIFDERHDLLLLFKSSRMLLSERERLSSLKWRDQRIEAHLVSLQAAMNEVYGLWANSYRFASRRAIERALEEGHSV